MTYMDACRTLQRAILPISPECAEFEVWGLVIQIRQDWITATCILRLVVSDVVTPKAHGEHADGSFLPESQPVS